MEFKPPIFLHSPPYQNIVEYSEDAVQCGFVILSVVVYPPSKDGITEAGYFIKTHTTAPVNAPAPHDSANLLGRFSTYGGTEVHKISTSMPLCASLPKRVAKKVKALILVHILPRVILTVDDPRLLRMKLQPALK